MPPIHAFRLCQYLWIAWVVIWLLWALKSKRTQQSASVASLFSYAIFVWASMYLMFIPRRLSPWWYSSVLPAGELFAWTGVAIAVLGFAFTLWARFTLGSNWSSNVTIKVDHQLIRTGPYRFVRHPIYTGLVVAMLGTAIALDEWRGLISVPLLWIGFTIKRLKEEQFMRQTFGDQYTDYAQATGAIFPTILRRGN